MKVGWMWLDDDSERSVEEKVARAVVAYRNKFRRKPNVCYVNEANPCEEQVGCVKVTRVRFILPNHFWLGVEREAA